MRPTAFFHCLLIVPAITFGLVAGAPAGRSDHVLGKRTTTYECDTPSVAALDAAFSEMKLMLTSAIDRTSSLITFLNNPPGDATSTGQLLKSTFNTFEAIFGKLEFGAGNSANADAISRVQTILNLATVMRNELQVISSNDYLEIYCTDYWLVSSSPDGTISETNPYFYWDNRDTKTMPLGIDFTISNGICRDDQSTHYAWVQPEMSSSQTTLRKTTVLTLCPSGLSDWVSKYQAGATMTSYKTKLWTSSDGVTLNDFQGGTLDDGSCEVNGRTQSAYGWYCITQLAVSAPSNAVQNADSFSFYVTAMYLSNYDWSTGIPVLMLTDSTPWYEDGLADLMSRVTLYG
ncbi:hypothetical protein TCE0_060f19537 [Talaromyces pinophilus]|uniref:Ig-like domain-containing protein n=1 Tax=Talaromyces pinophilus TaxID=128442 RepID=A0A6V8HQ21_TALPI|nr:hypothetical protein TCE0_060f19537 [Talaromyces pinophilus]